MSRHKFIAVGDIHGCPQSMEALLEKLSDYSDRTFVFVGDYIDRGPDSKRVVDLLIDFQKKQECVFMRGNHEQMLLDALDHGKYNLWLANGGKSTLNSYRASSNMTDLPGEHVEFYRNTKMYYDTENYFFVHAGLSPSNTIEQALEKDDEIQEFLWERSHLKVSETRWEKTLVFGHTPRRQPLKTGNMIGIDTGCVYSALGFGTLTAVLLPEEEFVQQDCIDE